MGEGWVGSGGRIARSGQGGGGGRGEVHTGIFTYGRSAEEMHHVLVDMCWWDSFTMAEKCMIRCCIYGGERENVCVHIFAMDSQQG